MKSWQTEVLYLESKSVPLLLKMLSVDTGSTRLCLPADMIRELGLPFKKEIKLMTVTGEIKARLFKRLSITVEGRKKEFDCTELPGGEDPLLGVIPLEKLRLQPDLMNKRLILLPEEDSN